MKLKKYFLSIVFSIISFGLFADSSFLPALEFEYVYRNNEFIFGTSEKGIDTKSYLEFLVSEENILGEKAALIVALASYFEFRNEKNENSFEEYTYSFEKYLQEKYGVVAIDADIISDEMKFLKTLMNDYGSFHPSIDAYDKFAEIMPQSLTVQTVKVVAFAYDIVYNKSHFEKLPYFIDRYEKEYLNPYMENFENYKQDINTKVINDVRYWRQYMSDDDWEQKTIEEENAKKQPRFTEFRTSEEIENEEWQSKITSETELENYILQLVTSREKSDYDNQWLCVQVLDKENRYLVQEIELGHVGRGDSFEIDDYNFDGYNDFSLFEGCGVLDNFYSSYFLFDPQTKNFFASGFDGTNLEFYRNTKTITSSSRCCAGTGINRTTYKLVDNRMVVLEKQCLNAANNEIGDVLLDEEGYLIFDEVDCYIPYLDIQLQSLGLKQNFQLRLAVYDEDMAGGFVLYDGQKERIPIHFERSENMKKEENYPKLFYYNEIYNGEINGVYSFKLHDTSFVDNVYYIRKKDGKKFTLKIK